MTPSGSINFSERTWQSGKPGPANHRAAGLWLSVVGAGAILLCYAAALGLPSIGLYHDDGLYLVTAKALAEGSGYQIISLPEDIPQTKYPILFPLALSALWRIDPSFPGNLALLRLLPFAAAIAWFWMVYRLLLHEGKSQPVAAGVLLLVATSPYVLFFSTNLLSETLFATLAWGGLLLLVRCETEGFTHGRLLGSALLCSAAFNTRTIGVTLIAAGVVSLALRRRLFAALEFGFLCVLMGAPWVLWVERQRAAIPEFLGYYTSANYGDWNLLLNFPWGEKLHILLWNVLYSLWAPAWLMGFRLGPWWPVLLGLGILTALGLVTSWRRGMMIVPIFMLFYSVTILLWAWNPVRFLVPVFPLTLFFAVIGWQRVSERFYGGHRARIVAVIVTVGVFLHAGWDLGRTALLAQERGATCPAICGIRWEEVNALFKEVDRTIPKTATVAVNYDPMLYLFTGRKAIRAFDQDPLLLHYSVEESVEPLGTTEALAGRLSASRVGYVVTMPGPAQKELFLWRQIGGLRREFPGALERVDDDGSAGSRIYRVDLFKLPELAQPAVMRGENFVRSNDSTTR